MGKFLRIVALLCCLGVLVLGTIALAPNGSLPSPFRGCSGGRISLTLPEALEQREQIALFEEASLRRLETKKRVAEEVIAGQKSLAKAMARFRALDQEWPQFGPAAKKAHDLGISVDEWDGRVVLTTVKLVLERRPDEAAAVVARLEKELQEILTGRRKRPTAPVEKPVERSR